MRFVGKVEGITTAKDRVIVTVSRGKKKRKRAVFFFPPNNKRFLAEFKRAQNHGLIVEVNYTEKKGLNIIQSLTVRGPGD